ncbi:hypothetical protein V499_03630 [Pseudogymnoascus sp. VKM F-103]|nr:hypothetical protein V499_03630 [Pseudogymnoascus sp. VKM F-103]OBT51035.1 hypothetical protein VE04_08072 [Pseudogymnoascus sp. 24MN13]
MAQPGILWVNSKITHPDAITPENFDKWYNDIHVPDILATSGFDSAFRYKNIDPKADRPYLAMYPVSDVDWLGSPEFSSIPNTSDCFPGPSHKCFDYADFDTRFYEFIHSYEKPGAPAGPTKLVISAGLTPAAGTDADFDAWYREEHYSTLAACSGYMRTRRYKLKRAVKAENPTTYLSLHEFECDVLPQADLDKTAETPWSKKIMGSLLGAEIGVYALSGAWGEVGGKI